MAETIVVEAHGPLFDGRAQHEVRAFLHDATEQVAAQGLADWQFNLDRSIRHPTPYYETQVHLQRVAEDRVEVNDGGIIYGPWLEGVGSRNRTTRFKGYASFRRAVQSASQKAPAIIARIAQRFVDRWNQ